MNTAIDLFKDVTTEGVLAELEATAEKYQGLYVDMEVAEQRKFVKEKASTITGLIKVVDRARIDLSKEYKAKVEDEAKQITTRLQAANEPFTLLIDEHNAERKRILDEEKARKAAAELAAQKEIDHEFALLLDKTYAADKAEAERKQLEHENNIREQAAAQVRADAEHEANRKAVQEENERLEREANTEHVRRINRKILVSLMQLGIAEDDAKRVIASIAKGKIQHLTINY